MKKFHLAEDKSPTHANLVRFLKADGWNASQFSAMASVNENWLEFPTQISETLEYKHRLALFLKDNQLAHLMPETFYIDDYVWPSVLNEMNKWHPAHTAWILKPSMLNNGQHIHIFRDIAAIEAHFLSSQRMGGPQVLQRYITHPKLIKGPTGGHKFSVRKLLVLSTHAGCAVFPSGYLNIALTPYQENNFSERGAHLTNEHLDHDRLNVIQRLSDEMVIFQPYKTRIIDICQLLVKAIKSQFINLWQDKQPQIACFGFDFMIEARSDKLWLLEANHGPCFPTDDTHPLFNVLYRPFWQQLIKQFIDKKTSDFILLDN